MGEPNDQRPAPRPLHEGVHLATNRCPFCHEDVAVEADAWVSCRSCQARHHPACWGEGGACSACGCDRRLSEADEPSLTAPTPRPDLARWGLGVGVAAAALGALGTLLSYQSTGSSLHVPFGPRVELGEPGLNALGMSLTAMVTLPLSLVGAGLGFADARANPAGRGRIALGLNVLYFGGMLALTIASF